MTEKIHIDDSKWELPDYEEVLYGTKHQKHALVIPVINEGERIRAQLVRIREANLPVDVVIADGGSTDGSLEFTVGVRAILKKTSPGKLSTQLRMAYAWCLREGYEGIITIDGNGKDGVEAVSGMVAKLEQGYDYVQGSRYLRGGKAENTPLERTIANRLVHAPLLSLAGRHWFTDTTNGFRAYSANYLLDARVQPFRNVFQNYELLFYLTVRAGQIGLKVGHIPVRRSYPESQKIPTKINGLSAKLRVFAQTLDTATGAYHPGHFDKNRRLFPLVFLLLTALMLVAYLPNPPFNTDSWAYYELAQTVFQDFYKFKHFRTYWSDSAYSSSFPMLFPVLIAIVSELVGYTPRVQYVLGFLFFIGFAFCAEHLLRKNLKMPYAGLGLSLLLASSLLRGELWEGRTIHLQLLLYTIIFVLVLRWKSFNFLQLLGLGAICGLGVLNRFDGIMLAPLLFMVHLLMFRKPLHSFAILLGALGAAAPWIIYSLSKFGTVFVSDNTWVAKSIDPRAYVLDWWPEPLPDMSDDFSAWLEKIRANTVQFGDSILVIGKFAFTEISNRVGKFASTAILIALVLFLSFNVGLLIFLKRVRSAIINLKDESRHFLRACCLFFLLMLFVMLPQILSGYFDKRYYSALFFFTFLICFSLVARSLASNFQKETVSSLFFLLCAALFSAALFLHYSHTRANKEKTSWNHFNNPPVLQQLQNCMGENSSLRLLVIGDNILAARLGAQGGFSTLMEPTNIRRGYLKPSATRQFITHWNVAYILVIDDTRLEWASSTFNLAKVPKCDLPLYKTSL